MMSAKGRIASLEDAFQPLMTLWLDWQEYNVMNEENRQLTLTQYIEKHSDDEALTSIFERAYNVYQDEGQTR